MGQAVRTCDGTGDYVDHELLDITTAFTLVWLGKRGANGVWTTLISHQNGSNAFRLAMTITNANRLALVTNNGSSSFSRDSSDNAGGGTTFTITTSDGYFIAVARKATGITTCTLSKYTAGGGWVHCITAGSMQHCATASGGKVRAFRFEAADDDYNGKGAVYAPWGEVLNDAAVESLDGGDRQAWKGIGSGYLDLIEFAVAPNGTVAAGNSTLIASEYGLLDQTAVNGNGTIDSSDLPSFYTLGAQPAGDAPEFTVDPVVSGTAKTNQAQSCSTGTVTGSPTPTFTYQWQRDDEGGGSFTDLSGETASTYTPVNDDLDCMIRCVVTATNTEGSDTATSNQLGPILPDVTSITLLRVGTDIVEVPLFAKIGDALIDPITEREWAP